MSDKLPLEVTPEMIGSSTSSELSTLESAEGDDVTDILPSQMVEAEAAGQTDVGRERQHNEDFFFISHQFTQQSNPKRHAVSLRGLYVLCDGMGGHAKGEVASALATEAIVQQINQRWQDDALPSHDSLMESILAANQAIYKVNEGKGARSSQDRMGTTMVLTLLQDTKVLLAHVGDSRIYALTASQGLEQLTVDHEVGQQEIQRGIDPKVAYGRSDAYQLTQALGPRKNGEIMPEIASLTIAEDTVLLLCSDGLTDHDLLETHCSTHLIPILNYRIGLQQGVNQLINLANQYNGHDNVTVLAIRIKVHPQQQNIRMGH
ncbi:MAG: serine/threonine phosphatase [Cyanobacteria bacterium P01_A01_bin.17]